MQESPENITAYKKGFHRTHTQNWLILEEEALIFTQQALAACHAEELQKMLSRLALAIRTQPVIVWTGELVEAAEDARVLLAKLENGV